MKWFQEHWQSKPIWVSIFKWQKSKLSERVEGILYNMWSLWTIKIDAHLLSINTMMLMIWVWGTLTFQKSVIWKFWTIDKGVVLQCIILVCFRHLQSDLRFKWGHRVAYCIYCIVSVLNIFFTSQAVLHYHVFLKKVLTMAVLLDMAWYLNIHLYTFELSKCHFWNT